MWSEDSINAFGKDHKFTQLLIDHTGIDPDDAFSKVPYEKGFHFVWYLDRVVGRQNFDKFIPYCEFPSVAGHFLSLPYFEPSCSAVSGPDCS